MLISYVPGEECRIAIVEDGQLEEFYQERASSESHVSNIYKGRITNVEPSIQAAFVDFGLERNGFLHISDVHPMYFPGKDREEFEQVGSKTPRRERPPIQKCFKRGQDVLVQVLKEGLGSKGPTVTSYLSIPGRFLVMMPYMQRLGVSRKVEDDDARKEMRDILKELDPPKEFGFIVRTAGIGQTKTDLKRDLAYLTRLWKSIERKMKQTGRVGELYAESDLMIRTIRDVFTTDIDRVVIDDPGAARRAHDFLAVANPRSRSKVLYYEDPIPLFHRYDIERQIETISAREVPLRSGGALVIDQTEALVAIDVNSGKSREARDAETNAYKTNEQAVDEICRQLRMRDLGGLVVLDLIDMMSPKHRRAIETRMRNNLKRDRARTRIGPISQFGLLEMTRQRMRPSLKNSLYTECGHCSGRGYTMSVESVVLRVMRHLTLAMQQKDVAKVELTISPDVAFHLLNRKRGELSQLERRHNIPVLVRVGGQAIDYLHLVATNDRGGPMELTLDSRSVRMPDPVLRELEGGALDEVFDDDGFDDVDSEDTQAEQEFGEQAYADEADAESGSDTGSGSGAQSSHPRDRQAEGEVGEDGQRRKRRRRRRGGRGRSKDGEPSDTSARDTQAQAGGNTAVDAWGDEGHGHDEDGEIDGNVREAQPAEPSESAEVNATDGDDQAPKKKRRRRRGGRGRRRQSSDEEGQSQPDPASEGVDAATQHPAADEAADAEDASELVDAVVDDADHAEADESAAPAARKKRRRRRRSKKSSTDQPADTQNTSDTPADRDPVAPATGTGGYGNRVLSSREDTLRDPEEMA